VEVPAGIDSAGLGFLEMLQIDPPVSDALVACMAKVPSDLS
jgi:hypothetical protein